MGLRESTLQQRIEDDSLYGSSLLAICYDTLGAEVFELEPTTILLELGQRYGARPPEINVDKLMSLIVAMSTDQFYRNFETFSATCMSLNNEAPDFSMFEPVDPVFIATTVAEVLINDPPDNSEISFSPEIASYVGVMLREHGVYAPPKILAFADYPGKNPILAVENPEMDPMLWQTAWEMQQAEKTRLEEIVQERIEDIVNQVASLPLINKSK